MKKIILATALVLTGCSVSNSNPIVGKWEEKGGCNGKKSYCSFTIEKAGMFSSFYNIRFDVVEPGFPNTGRLYPNSEGVFRYTDVGTTRGIAMYLSNGTLIEGYNGTQFKKVGQ